MAYIVFLHARDLLYFYTHALVASFPRRLKPNELRLEGVLECVTGASSRSQYHASAERLRLEAPVTIEIASHNNSKHVLSVLAPCPGFPPAWE
jgi:hypothetical protein